MSATPAYDALTAHHARLHRLSHLQAIATWDRMTHMPPGGADARAAAQAELAVVMKEAGCNPSVDRWLAEAAAEALEPDQAANLRLMQREQRVERAVPADLAGRREVAVGAAMQAWGAAKAGNDWTAFISAWKPLLAIVRDEATRLGDALDLSPRDALLERFEPGLRGARVDALFGDVERWLPGLVNRVLQRQQHESPPLEPAGPFAPEAQRRLCERVVKLLGFDFDGGRLDASAHPFTGGVPEDVRLTTRFDPTSPLPALVATVHETGHARYQQNLPRAWLGQPLAGPHSAALHEGQALSFERQLLPSAACCTALAPLLAEAFGAQPAFEPGNLVRLLQRVRPGPIRVTADELTYPLHVILRVQIEAALIAGELEADDVPAWWDERMQRLLGIDTRGDFTQGPLQDIHWAQGMFGYFPAYLLGAMVAAQCVAALRADVPDLDAQVAAGDTRAFGDWLQQHVWRHGARFDLDATLQQATGRPLCSEALRRHLEKRHVDGR